jgi:Sulfotransferase domain
MMLTLDLEATESPACTIHHPSEELSETAVLVPRTHPRDAAEGAFMAALDAAREASHFQSLFDQLRFVFPKWRLPFIFEQLDSTLAALGEESADLLTLRLRLRISLRDFDGFLDLFERSSVYFQCAANNYWRQRFERLDSILRRNKFPDFQARKVFGIGLSRTGTQSLTIALRRLGFLSSHFENEFSMQLLDADDAIIFDAMTDAPVCTQFELLYDRFENAKFIWTKLRHDRWLDAFKRHCLRTFGTTNFSVIREIPRRFQHRPDMLDLEKIDCTLYFRHDNAEQAYEAYRNRVEGFFTNKPKDKLLILEAGDGREWSKLCDFLSCDVPDEPYPWENKS